jgi:hypothetical protein
MNTTQPTTITDSSLMLRYPIQYAKEALILCRRLEFLRLMCTEAPLSQHDALSDCRDFDEYVESLIKTRHISVASYAYKHDYFKFREIALSEVCSSATQSEEDDDAVISAQILK